MPRFLILIIALITPPITAAPPTPIPGERAATYVARYNEWLETIPMEDRAWEELQRIDQLIHRAFYEHGGPTDDPNDGERWDATVQFIKDNPEVMDAIRTNATKPELGMPIQFAPIGFDDEKIEIVSIRLILPNITAQNTQFKLLLADIIAHPDHLVQNTKAMMSINRQTEFTQGAVEYLTILARLRQLAARTIHESRDPSDFDDPGLVALDHALSMNEQTARPRSIIRHEQFIAIDALHWLYAELPDNQISYERFLIFGGEGPADHHSKETTTRLKFKLQLSGPLEDQLAYIQNYYSKLTRDFQQPIHALQKYTSNDLGEMLPADQADDSTNRKPSNHYLPARVIITTLHRVHTQYAQSLTELNATRLLIAAHRHKLTHGSFPQTLADFDPTFLTFTPTDLFTGNPLHYRLADNQPLIYSSGTDRDDDNARPLLDEDGIPIDPPPFYPLDPLKEILKNDPQSIDGDWVLTPS